MNKQNEKIFDAQGFQRQLLEWYQGQKRELPWRIDGDPYKVWVSEIMLQQTRVDTVIPYFCHFMEQFPTVQDLAYAEEEKVLKAWEGLGYYSRARNLHQAAKEVTEMYGGKVPDTKVGVSNLKGVGPYTAGAILSIAYGMSEPAVDGNVMRVLSRIFAIDDDIGRAKTRKRFEAIVREIIAHDNPSDFNQGMMELGALICTPTSPSCLLCPVRDHCQAYEKGIETHLPVKAKKKKPKTLQMVAAVISDENGRFLINQRSDNGLLAKLWEFPNCEDASEDFSTIRSYIRDQFHLDVTIKNQMTEVHHVFTHLIWDIRVVEMKVTANFRDEGEPQGIWIDADRFSKYPFPVSHQKIIDQIIQ
ncbi:A/G-specific adenine glycosylase [Texcoconibacillus texcoconensis]|uniref:Adenine DNA glycosylase n=1 Tax=Texcoconibacillus texcoconensis TaxID=1095777 RepID=A0A840QTK0_9BACI|nr:A/G-specific adenine glycosylase [Texcoconibacillus texcoconensis]MBB5174628.1 A/G-specific adenine glycosylase [Texcoconibacillus texcoconensis]